MPLFLLGTALAATAVAAAVPSRAQPTTQNNARQYCDCHSNKKIFQWQWHMFGTQRGCENNVIGSCIYVWDPVFIGWWIAKVHVCDRQYRYHMVCQKRKNSFCAGPKNSSQQRKNNTFLNTPSLSKRLWPCAVVLLGASQYCRARHNVELWMYKYE